MAKTRSRAKSVVTSRTRFRTAASRVVASRGGVQLPRVKAVHPARPDVPYFLLEPSPRVAKALVKPQIFFPKCDKACTKTLTLLPKVSVAGHSGLGFAPVNVNGFRWINAYVISDPLTSSAQRGFSLALSFSLFPFVLGVGVVGETSFFFDFDDWFDPGSFSHRTIRCQTSDLTTVGGVPQLGGVDLTHILRAPVMGPFVRASAFNEDDKAHNVQVLAYLST